MDPLQGHARDVLIAVLVVGGVLLGLFLYTGNWPPPVVIESNSMMHIQPSEYDGNTGDTRADGVPYGRFGTIDPGDLVLVKKQEDPDEIETFAHGGEEHYGKPGEVVVYFKNGDQGTTPIIHRAMTWVDVERTPDGSRTYDVVWSEAWEEAGRCRTEDGQRICRFAEGGITIRELGLTGKHVEWDGFLTKGDNEATNRQADQVSGIVSQPVRIDWVQGVARGELPWVGLIKLTITGFPKNSQVQDHPYFWSLGQMTAPRDLWVMLAVSITTLVALPFGADVAYERWRQARGPEDEGQPAEDRPPDHHGEGPEASTGASSPVTFRPPDPEDDAPPPEPGEPPAEPDEPPPEPDDASGEWGTLPSEPDDPDPDPEDPNPP